MDLGGLAKHTNVTHQYLIAHKNLFTEKERQTMMNVFVKSGRIALFKLISTLFHCDPDCESHSKVRMRFTRVNGKSWNEKFQNVFDIWMFHIFKPFLIHLVGGTAAIMSSYCGFLICSIIIVVYSSSPDFLLRKEKFGRPDWNNVDF